MSAHGDWEKTPDPPGPREEGSWLIRSHGCGQLTFMELFSEDLEAL